MIIETERLILRPWEESDAEKVYEYCKEDELASPTGFPAHKNVEESLKILKNVLMVPETYALCLKESGMPIGNISLKLAGTSDITDKEDEGELGYWLGKDFWGMGYMPEAGRALIKHIFEDLGMTRLWCGYYEGNEKSKRSQEKMGFRLHSFVKNVDVPLLGIKRNAYVSVLTKEQWSKKLKFTLKRTSGSDSDFIENCRLLDMELDKRSGKILNRDFFRQFCKTDDIGEAVVSYVDGKAAGSGAIRRYMNTTACELKRMYVKPEYQGMGIASAICEELEVWAKSLGYSRIIIETGKHLTEANALYRKMGFSVTPNFPPYENETTSVCFEKKL